MPITINGNGTITGLSDESIDASKLKNGGVIQVQHLQFNEDNYSVVGNMSDGWREVTNFNKTITPATNTNKILVDCRISCGGANNLYGAAKVMYKVDSGSWQDTEVTDPFNDTGGNAMTPAQMSIDTDVSYGTYKVRSASCCFLHNPTSTGVLTYQLFVQARHPNTDFSIWLNRPHTNDSTNRATGVSSLTLMEVVA